MSECCDCDRVHPAFALDCELINQSCQDGRGNGISPPAAAALPVLPQPFKLEIVQACDLEDPDLRPYFWDCHD